MCCKPRVSLRGGRGREESEGERRAGFCFSFFFFFFVSLEHSGSVAALPAAPPPGMLHLVNVNALFSVPELHGGCRSLVAPSGRGSFFHSHSSEESPELVSERSWGALCS